MNIQYAQNQMSRAAKKLERADKSAHGKVKRCLEKGKVDDAKREATVRTCIPCPVPCTLRVLFVQAVCPGMMCPDACHR